MDPRILPTVVFALAISWASPSAAQVPPGTEQPTEEPLHDPPPVRARERPEVRIALAMTEGESDTTRATAVCEALLNPYLWRPGYGGYPERSQGRQPDGPVHTALCADLLTAAALAEAGPPDSLIHLALALNPLHPHARLAQIDRIEAHVLPIQSATSRIASWCLSDRYALLAASTDHPSVRATALQKAERYGNVRLNTLFMHPTPTRGQMVSANLGPYGTCQTPVR